MITDRMIKLQENVSKVEKDGLTILNRRTVKQTLKNGITNADPEFESVRNKIKEVKRKYWKNYLMHL